MLQYSAWLILSQAIKGCHQALPGPLGPGKALWAWEPNSWFPCFLKPGGHGLGQHHDHSHGHVYLLWSFTSFNPHYHHCHCPYHCHSKCIASCTALRQFKLKNYQAWAQYPTSGQLRMTLEKGKGDINENIFYWLFSFFGLSWSLLRHLVFCMKLIILVEWVTSLPPLVKNSTKFMKLLNLNNVIVGFC